jgi:putative flippase GtrA
MESPHASGFASHRVATRMLRSQLVRFALVGASGFVVNLVVYAAALRLLGIHYELAALAAFLAAVANNYILNRRWTFLPSGRAPSREAARFFGVSLVGFAVNAALLALFVEGGTAHLPAQLIAIIAAAAANFVLNRAWTFSPVREH